MILVDSQAKGYDRVMEILCSLPCEGRGYVRWKDLKDDFGLDSDVLRLELQKLKNRGVLVRRWREGSDGVVLAVAFGTWRKAKMLSTRYWREVVG